MPAVSGPSVVCPQSLGMSCTMSVSLWVISCTMSVISGHVLYYVRSLWSCPVLCPAVSGHVLYYVRSLWSCPVLCPQSLVMSCTMSAVSWSFSCTMSAVSGHLLYYVCSLWSSPCTMSAVHWFRIFFSLFSSSKI
ncbi:unnamed protein product [Staurois parvus]|uniref:Uncharacterized protein n=1 Tax=Staurois parvus TaxID=386267 RepID=A0ABN9CGQ6_9NEOB|nr:unnamed protein product [Staurois parvus]